MGLVCMKYPKNTDWDKILWVKGLLKKEGAEKTIEMAALWDVGRGVILKGRFCKKKGLVPISDRKELMKRHVQEHFCSVQWLAGHKSDEKDPLRQYISTSILNIDQGLSS